ncbi:MotA/TolQ/ExbB proton channel family protein [Pseudobacteriovorax antillogorgiicola]|uniref:Outer membrane transport energization protein ExbB n=1 Tax=Pseudobacteriovorax antillogorgiicola TaxID=1513793 RepID=A0A1Y6BVF8_9BACT|nr:MotA/TolQ/ExbB proton channel family protein [Pseudobacteriovorax antillogorgiicola]TCS53921.1 outer membrane transport energization protein ExbB [Pseudobacteriovorax antillogorgiicola]SMF20569.1 outer membrane transport energization protein ExbB [Pseudobacteriovorax antillogorgiicola]
MIFLFETWEVIRDFLETGGQVLLVIALATLVLWTLILEKYYYFFRVYPAEAKGVVGKWQARKDKSSWAAHRIREALISDVGTRLDKSVGLIKTMVAICPLLGLMGTVTGMISVFEIMGYTGTSNARLMASGISMATIPTMAGMVASLSGLYFGSRLESKAKKARDELADQLPYN